MSKSQDIPAGEAEPMQLFVSYSRTDRDWVENHLDQFVEAGFDPWYDDSISAGADWRDTISDEIERSAALLCVVSPRSVASQRCLEEVDFALELDRPILVVHVEETALPNRLRFRLANRQAILAWQIGDEVIARKLLDASLDVREQLDRKAPDIASPPRRRLRLAVLPFESISKDAEFSYLCDGLTEEVINYLGTIYRERVDVIARSSAMMYRGKSVADVSAGLEADTVVEGSVHADGGYLRLRVSAVRSEDQVQIWNGSFTGRVEEGGSTVFDVQEAIARGVAEALDLPISKETSRPYGSATSRAQEAYLKGRFHWYQHSPEDFRIAEAYFKDAVTADPSFAPAYIGLADAIGTPAHRGEVPARDVFPEAIRLIDKALEIDPSSAEAHDMRARIAFAFDHEWESSRSGFEHAIELNPSYPDAFIMKAQLLSIVGDKVSALEHVQRGLDLDPHNVFFQSQLAVHLTGVERHQEAIEIYRSLPDTFPLRHELLWGVEFRVGDYSNAYRHARQFFAGNEGISQILQQTNDVADAESYCARMSSVAELLENASQVTYVPPSLIARLFTHADNAEKAAQWLSEAAEMQDSFVVYAALMPEYSRVWESDGYRAFVTQIGLDRYHA